VALLSSPLPQAYRALRWSSSMSMAESCLGLTRGRLRVFAGRRDVRGTTLHNAHHAVLPGAKATLAMRGRCVPRSCRRAAAWSPTRHARFNSLYTKVLHCPSSSLPGWTPAVRARSLAPGTGRDNGGHGRPAAANQRHVKALRHAGGFSAVLPMADNRGQSVPTADRRAAPSGLPVESAGTEWGTEGGSAPLVRRAHDQRNALRHTTTTSAA
jgi:hypothetical protein